MIGHNRLGARASKTLELERTHARQLGRERSMFSQFNITNSLQTLNHFTW